MMVLKPWRCGAVAAASASDPGATRGDDTR